MEKCEKSGVQKLAWFVKKGHDHGTKEQFVGRDRGAEGEHRVKCKQ